MDLLCTESINSVTEAGGDQLSSSNSATQQTPMEVRLNTAVKDPTFLDDRCLENLLKSEERHARQHSNYFATVQKDITPDMRRVVAEWIIDVSTPSIHPLISHSSSLLNRCFTVGDSDRNTHCHSN